MKILDLGCGKNKHVIKDAEVIGLDKFPLEGVDVVHDLEKRPIPFKDNEFDEIYAVHVLEHIDNFFSVMEEAHRILKPGGIFKIWVPYGLAALGMPDHKRFFTFRTFEVFNENHPDSYFTVARFKIKKAELTFVTKKRGWGRVVNAIFNPIINFNHKFTQRFLRFLPISRMYIELECVK